MALVAISWAIIIMVNLSGFPALVMNMTLDTGLVGGRPAGMELIVLGRSGLTQWVHALVAGTAGHCQHLGIAVIHAATGKTRVLMAAFAGV